MIDFSLFVNSLGALLRGVQITLLIAVASCSIGLIVGTGIAIAQKWGNSLAKGLTTAFITVVRGTPMLIQILFVFYVLPQIGIHISSIAAAILAIGLNSSAYLSQVILSGLSSIDPGQMEAAKLLGFSKRHSFFYIILPQAVTNILPALGNELITLVKDSSLASIIGVMELSKEGSLIRARTYDAFTILLAVGLIYLVLTSAISFTIKKLEKRFSLHAKSS